MTPLFKKLNLRPTHTTIVVVNVPNSFEPELSALGGVHVIRDTKAFTSLDFGLAFAITQRDLDAATKVLTDRAEGDAVIWVAYPKRTSKRFRCEFNRDAGWSGFGDAGYEPVRIVAIDDDWSALRLRRTEFIKSLTRDARSALSSEGKARTKTRNTS